MRDISNMGSNYFKHWLWMFEQDGKMPCMQLKMYAKYTQLALMYSLNSKFPLLSYTNLISDLFLTKNSGFRPNILKPLLAP